MLVCNTVRGRGEREKEGEGVAEWEGQLKKANAQWCETRLICRNSFRSPLKTISVSENRNSEIGQLQKSHFRNLSPQKQFTT